jgi:hypothetical protein
MVIPGYGTAAGFYRTADAIPFSGEYLQIQTRSSDSKYEDTAIQI